MQCLRSTFPVYEEVVYIATIVKDRFPRFGSRGKRSSIQRILKKNFNNSLPLKRDLNSEISHKKEVNFKNGRQPKKEVFNRMMVNVLTASHSYSCLVYFSMQLARSNESRVTLKSVNFNTTGLFRVSRTIRRTQFP